MVGYSSTVVPTGYYHAGNGTPKGHGHQEVKLRCGKGILGYGRCGGHFSFFWRTPKRLRIVESPAPPLQFPAKAVLGSVKSPGFIYKGYTNRLSKNT
jgi:hypothetical protein